MNKFNIIENSISLSLLFNNNGKILATSKSLNKLTNSNKFSELFDIFTPKSVRKILAVNDFQIIDLYFHCNQTNNPFSALSVSLDKDLRLLLISSSNISTETTENILQKFSHDIRTPLGIIKGNTELLLSEQNNSSKSKKQREMTESILQASNLVLEIIEKSKD